VVSVCRTIFPFEANTRMFETMAGGGAARGPRRNEISDLGFEEGTHFVAYRDEAEIVPLVRAYLNDETPGVGDCERG